MSKFIKVTEQQYGDKLFLNIENVSYVHADSGTVMINAVHGEGNGIMRFDKNNIQIIVDAIKNNYMTGWEWYSKFKKEYYLRADWISADEAMGNDAENDVMLSAYLAANLPENDILTATTPVELPAGYYKQLKKENNDDKTQ